MISLVWFLIGLVCALPISYIVLGTIYVAKSAIQKIRSEDSIWFKLLLGVQIPGVVAIPVLILLGMLEKPAGLAGVVAGAVTFYFFSIRKRHREMFKKSDELGTVNIVVNEIEYELLIYREQKTKVTSVHIVKNGSGVEVLNYDFRTVQGWKIDDLDLIEELTRLAIDEIVNDADGRF